MGVPGSANALLLASTAAGGYTISRSLRFNSSDSAYLSRTPSSAGNRTTWTLSFWTKISSISSSWFLLRVAFGNNDNDHFNIILNTTGTLQISGYNTVWRTTTQVFRDFSAWYHFVIVADTNNGTADNRLRLYVNGSEITTFSTKNNPSSGATFGVNAAHTHIISDSNGYINGYLADIWFLDGLTPTTAVVNGVTRLTQLGEFDTNGIWQPKAWDGAALTGNSFHLDFADNSAATATTLGKDTSGNGHNWDPYSLSVTAGAGNDSLVDSPSNYGTDTGVGGEVRGNYATFNPLLNSNLGTLANGNLEVTGGSSAWHAFSTIAVSSGKWYCEFTGLAGGASSDYMVGIVDPSTLTSGQAFDYSANGYGYRNDAKKTNNNLVSSYGATYALDHAIGVAFDADAGTLTFYKNGTSQGQAFSGLSTTRSYVFAVFCRTSSDKIAFNAGQRPFAYTAPSGFKALCTANLPEPTIADGSTVMDVKLYTGNGSTQTISGLNFSPDWVWIKARNLGYFHRLIDSVRGAQKFLYSNVTDEEGTSTANDIFTSFDSTGFTLGGAAPSADGLNQNTQPYVAWAWDAGANSSKTYTVTVVSGKFHIDGKQQPTLNLEEGSTYTFDLSAASNSGHPFRLSTSANGPTEYTTGVTTSGTAGNAGATLTIAVASGAPTLYYFCTNHSGMGEQINTNTTAGASNFAGSITSSVRANASAGFSIVTYTGNGSSTDVTIGHGLGVAPQLVIVKSRGSASNGNWRVGHSSLATNNNLLLNTTDAQFSATSIAAGGGVATSHSSTTITLKAGPGGGGFNPTDYVNQNTITYVAYCFAPVAGYSSFGSYTGNGSADGPFVFCNFRPRWILIKNTSTTADWCLFDTARDTYNQALGLLNPNLSNAENILGSGLDILSNGFKLRRDASPAINNSANTFVYAAFAESPFAYARAR